MSSANGNLDYLGSLAQVGASISQGRDYRQTSLRASGNVLAHAGGSRWRRSWATPSACCMHRTPGRADHPRPQQPHRWAGLWPGALSDAVSKQQRGTGFRRHGRRRRAAEQYAYRGAARRVVLLSYPTRRSRPVLVDGKQRDGAPLPFGAEVYDLEDGEVIGSVGQGSRIVMRVRKDEAASACAGDRKPTSAAASTTRCPSASAARAASMWSRASASRSRHHPPARCRWRG